MPPICYPFEISVAALMLPPPMSGADPNLQPGPAEDEECVCPPSCCSEKMEPPPPEGPCTICQVLVETNGCSIRFVRRQYFVSCDHPRYVQLANDVAAGRLAYYAFLPTTLIPVDPVSVLVLNPNAGRTPIYLMQQWLLSLLQNFSSLIIGTPCDDELLYETIRDMVPTQYLYLLQSGNFAPVYSHYCDGNKFSKLQSPAPGPTSLQPGWQPCVAEVKKFIILARPPASTSSTWKSYGTKVDQFDYDRHNYAPGNASLLLLATDDTGPKSLTGLSMSQVDGQRVVIKNIGSFDNLILPYESSLSSSANRFINPPAAGSDTIVPGQTVAYRYSTAYNRWVKEW